MESRSSGAAHGPDATNRPPSADTGSPGKPGTADLAAHMPPQPGTPAAESMNLLQQIAQQIEHLRTDPRDTQTVQKIIDAYLNQVGDEISESALEMRQHTLKLFGKHFGRMQLAQCSPIQLKEWLKERKSWASSWTKMRANADIQRVFNWAAALRMVRENPFRGLAAEFGRRTTCREMHPEEFQAILRTSDIYFRRLLIALKMTGARPAELSALQWTHIDWIKGLGILERHKTARKTRKPRVIVFTPPGMKLLSWIFRRRKGRAAVELQRILQSSPNHTLGVREVSKQMLAMGFSARQIYGARRLIGAKFERVGGWGAKGRTVYSLPANPLEASAPYESFVFLCSKSRPWNRHAICVKFRRLRKALGLPEACKVYGLRHAFITNGVRRNTNLKALATLVGHSNTRMIETTYCHVDQDFEFLRTAALKALGQSGLAHQVIPQPNPADTGAASPAEPSAAPAPGSSEELLRMLVQRIQTLEGELKTATESKAPKECKLRPAHVTAYKLSQQALRENPELRHATDEAVYGWLHARPEYRDLLPPTAVSFSRYLNQARRVMNQSSKRAKRRENRNHQDPNPQAPKGDQSL
jgi:integrase